MAKFQLRSDVAWALDDPLNRSSGAINSNRANVRLEDDIGSFTLTDTTPRMNMWTRAVVGRDDSGDRVFDWTQWMTDVPVISSEGPRTEIVDGVTILKVRVVLLYAATDIPSTIGIELTHGSEGTISERIFRVTEVYQNGVRLELVGERVLDAS